MSDFTDNAAQKNIRFAQQSKEDFIRFHVERISKRYPIMLDVLAENNLIDEVKRREARAPRLSPSETLGLGDNLVNEKE